eukprot:3827698-Heterocapsa_arctica.AAC.1
MQGCGPPWVRVTKTQASPSGTSWISLGAASSKMRGMPLRPSPCGVSKTARNPTLNGQPAG